MLRLVLCVFLLGGAGLSWGAETWGMVDATGTWRLPEKEGMREFAKRGGLSDPEIEWV